MAAIIAGIGAYLGFGKDAIDIWKAVFPRVEIQTVVANLSNDAPEIRLAAIQGLAGNRKFDDHDITIVASALESMISRRTPKIDEASTTAASQNETSLALKALGELFRQIDSRKIAAGKPTIKGVDLSGVDLSHGYFRGFTFQRVYARRATFSSSDLTGAKLVDVQMQRIVAQEADLTKATIQFSCFEEADLENALMVDSRISGSDFNNANFSHAKLMRSVFSETRLQSCDMKGADLSESDLSSATEFNASQVDQTVMKGRSFKAPERYIKAPSSMCR